ncbi:hypothetical protein JST56_06465 [Candidatus Dependentiae bacterium]|jgi:hypothetical protein|nr:hypothetical protein [Candidatus Dependentiae bacterium]
MEELFGQITMYQARTPDKDFKPIFKELFDACNNHLKSTRFLSGQQYKNFLNEGLYGQELFALSLEEEFLPLDSMIEANALWLLSQSFIEQQDRFIILAGGFHINPSAGNLDPDHENEFEMCSENSLGLSSYLEIGGYTHVTSLDIRSSLMEGMQEVSRKIEQQLVIGDDKIMGECKNLLGKLATDIADFITEWTLKTDSQINKLLSPEFNIITQDSETQNDEQKTPTSFAYDNSSTNSWCTLL